LSIDFPPADDLTATVIFAPSNVVPTVACRMEIPAQTELPGRVATKYRPVGQADNECFKINRPAKDGIV
jgi:hypothetical protein